MNTCKIYTLSYPGTDNVFYVGCTKQDLSERLRAHQYRNLKPTIDLVEEVPGDEGFKTETFWIRQFTAWGFNLLNQKYSYADPIPLLKTYLIGQLLKAWFGLSSKTNSIRQRKCL